MSRLGDQRGVTLVELLITMMIAMIAMGGVLGILEVLLRQSHQSRQQAEAQDQARAAVDRLAGQLRNALASPGVAPTAVERAEAYDLIFQTVDPFTAVGTGNRLGAMRVRYCLDNADPSRAVLRLQSQRWSTPAAPAVPAATACTAAANGWDDSRVVATDLVNRLRAPERPVWSYTPASLPSLAAIQAIGTTLVVDREAGSVRGERALASGVALRNANRPPVAGFTVSQAGGYVVLNGSSSYDPDGDALSFRWFLDGVEVVGETGRIFKRAGLTGTHTFRLEVFDASGLEGKTIDRTVVVS